MNSSKALKVAIQGGGLAASVCARTLSEAGINVAVFESGRGPGGRMSTRRAKARSNTFQWDHGAQYFSPKSEEFSDLIQRWQDSGLVDVWDGQHCVWSTDNGIVPDPKVADRFVGVPGMNAICKGLLEDGSKVKTVYETRAVASHVGSMWRLSNAKSGADLGSYDFLVTSDKTAALPRRPDLDACLIDFKEQASSIKSAKSLVLLLATDPLNLPFDSLLLEGHADFSWIAKDSSKPGRSRDDNTECWVAQASPDINIDVKGFPNAVRKQLITELTPRFEALVSDLGGTGGRVHLVQGHRWGAAFPLSSIPSVEDFYIDEVNSFAATGDYFTAYPGRVEGAALSGSRLAAALLSKFYT
ncbi:hypothetical protein TrCOL_g12704 [Triparma columacea]|uniref:Uncharacterized protein n=1 Tax=Triparma columacea TaxID=722753 RepID=A0A9W7GHJ4_9STRA|nr:hypothetical protein TrCOL_g12704 [Triparma columacea]